ncbi:helix-turn-helix domain-containing protein [Leucobacter sp. wl10]|uniref:helix-turn-helix domain-containing protein n=1 Tax=Leucobacter sp. wl10 TaxID=2304677 RepID=UPI000E5C36A6|nr:helix-turn-helix domain-containing protein [Leucobacter sp. wl10]RGE19069.1 DNA-binding protein [Leucobacter sp. wl10]
MNGEAPEPLELFLVPTEAAAQLGVSVRKLRRLRQAEVGPAYFTIGSRIRYLAADVAQWRSDHPDGVQIPRRRAA